MLNVLSSFGALVSLYFFGTLLYLFLSKRKKPYLSYNELEKQFTGLSSEELKKAELHLTENPGDFKIRMSVLKSLFLDGSNFHSPGIGIEHANWVIEHKPQYISSVLVQTPFLIIQNREATSKELMIRAIEKENRSIESLRSASRFCNGLNYEFALACAEELFQKENLNPEVLFDVATLQGFLTKDDDDIKQWKKSWSSYEKYLSWPWDEYDFWKLESLAKNLGKYFWPYPMRYMFLFIKGRLSNGLIGYTDSAFNLAMVGTVALNAQEYSNAARIGKSLKKKLPTYEINCHHAPLLFTSFSFLARLALAENKMEEVQFYLKKREQFAAESEFELPSEVANSLIKANQIQMALDHYTALTKNIADNKGVQRDIRIIKSGRLINAKTYKEEYEKEKTED